MILGNPPHQTPAVNPRAYFQQPWAAWFSTLKALFDALSSTAAGALQAANNLSDLASSPAALSNLIGAWQTWAPGITCDAGMVVSAVTITTAEYLAIGSLVLFNLNCSFTLSGTAALRVFITLPTLPVNSSSGFSIAPGSTSTNQSLIGRSDSANYSLFRPSPSANWTLGAQGFICAGHYRRV
jgi:hypothetical protein